MLWSQLDALHYAYVTPGLIPPGAFVPEDRRLQSIVPDFSVRENLLLGHLSAYRGFGLGYASRNARIAELMRYLD